MRLIILCFLSLFLVPSAFAEELPEENQTPIEDNVQEVLPEEETTDILPSEQIPVGQIFISGENSLSEVILTDYQFTIIQEELVQNRMLTEQILAHVWWINVVWILGTILFLLIWFILYTFIRR